MTAQEIDMLARAIMALAGGVAVWSLTRDFIKFWRD